MITEIDLKDVLARSLGSAHRDLVTRSTGAKVRCTIEETLSAQPADDAVVLDFSSVRVLDCSCADEVVAKLLLLRADRHDARRLGHPLALPGALLAQKMHSHAAAQAQQSKRAEGELIRAVRESTEKYKDYRKNNIDFE